LSWTRQEEILSQKQDPTAYGGENQGQISQQFQKKAKGVNVGCDYGRRISPPLQHARSHQQTGSYSGTGVFFPRGETSAPFGSRKRPGIVSVHITFWRFFVFGSQVVCSVVVDLIFLYNFKILYKKFRYTYI